MVVCDGFTGNVILKLTEGVAKTVSYTHLLELAHHIACALQTLFNGACLGLAFGQQLFPVGVRGKACHKAFVDVYKRQEHHSAGVLGMSMPTVWAALRNCCAKLPFFAIKEDVLSLIHI